MQGEGLLIIVSGPSGTGKGTVLKLLKDRNDKVRFSVSATTRKPRLGETDGQSYFFKTSEEFKAMIQNDELVEWVEYCDNFYGTPKIYVEDCMSAGYDVILEIEVKGAINIKKAYPESVAIFILPPSFDDLRKRIEGRGTETPETIRKRLEKAKKEIELADQYDYVVINDDLEEAVVNINSIIRSEKLKIKRNADILSKVKQEGKE